MAIDFTSFMDPKSFSGPNPLYAGASSLLGDDIAGMLDPLSGLLSGLFGGGESWKPYIDEQGNYVWRDPKKHNPVPVATVPGASLKPDKGYRKMAGQVQAITDLLPAYSRAVAGQIIPQAQAELAAQQVTSPQLAELMTRLYEQYGPQLNKIGTDIGRQNALEQAKTDSMVLAGPGRKLIEEALSAAKIYDPEYFKTRELASSRLGDLLRSIDISGNLSGSERAEVERSLAQEGGRRGTYNAPSNLETVSNAMQFGDKGFQRQQQNRGMLSAAISNATAALPAFKSGTDVFQVATGKSSQPNTGEGKFAGVNNVGNAINTASGLATGVMGNLTDINMLDMQIDSQKKDWADYLNQVTSSIGNLTSSAGSIAGMMCWIARRAYGENNPRWMEFRHYLMTKAPAKLREFYREHGQQIASTMTDEDASNCRNLMNRILGYV